MTRRMVVVVPILSLVALVVAPTTAWATSPESKVTVGSPTTPYLPNGSNEPALAMDANHPEVLAAGANDLVDNAPCVGNRCDPRTSASRASTSPSTRAGRGPNRPTPG